MRKKHNLPFSPISQIIKKSLSGNRFSVSIESGHISPGGSFRNQQFALIDIVTIRSNFPNGIDGQQETTER